jgi:glycosyltransferase involved in cell wall biosynthesis
LAGIREGEHILAFRGNPQIADQYKGMAWLREALELYEPTVPTTLLIMQDASGFWPLSKKYRIVDLGWVDGEVLANALSAADLFLMPSVQEAFGLMAVEAMACGTPVIVFEGTSLPEVIRAPEGGGTAVPMKDSRALAEEIARLLADDEAREGLGRRAREIAEREYPHSLYVRRHLELYRSLLENTQ